MPQYDLAVTGGRVLLGEGEPIEAELAIRNGKIAAILTPGSPIDAAANIDVTGLVVLPGVIDAHLHLGHGRDIARPRVPGDAAQETAAAAAGGITTFISYLMATDPFETIFADVLQVTEAGARIDFGYHFIISTEAQLAAVQRYIAEFGAPCNCNLACIVRSYYLDSLCNQRHRKRCRVLVR